MMICGGFRQVQILLSFRRILSQLIIWNATMKFGMEPSPEDTEAFQKVETFEHPKIQERNGYTWSSQTRWWFQPSWKIFVEMYHLAS